MDIIELTMLGQTISMQHNVDVRIAAPDDQASCRAASGSKRHVITLPYVAADDADVYYRGYLDHEVGHVRFTEFGYSAPEIEEYGDFGHGVFNIFEDVHIEKKMGDVFPGARLNLQRLARKLFTLDHVKQFIDGKNILDMCMGLALYVRRRTLDDKLPEENVKKLVRALRRNGMSQQDIDELIDIAGKSASSTREAMQQAVEFCAYVKSECQQQPQGSGGNDQQQKGAGEQQEGSSGQSQQGDDDSQQQSGSGDMQQQQSSGNSRPNLPEDTTSAADRAADMGSMVSEALNARGRQTPDYDKAQSDAEMAAYAMMRTEHRPDTRRTDMKSPVDQRVYGNLSRVIPPLLQSMQYRPAVTGRRGKLDGRMLHRSAVSDDRVFLKRAERTERKVEVGLLMDYSGSMDGNEPFMNQGAFAMCKMLKSIPGVRAFLMGFQHSTTSLLVSPDTPMPKEVRWHSAGGGTPTGPAVIQSNFYFTHTKDTRKLLFIFTDGRPDSDSILRMALRGVQKRGVEVYGVGMTGMDLSEFFDDRHWICVQDMARDFTPKLADMMRKALVRAVAA
ncbi:MAG: hypothetical protein HDQ88_07050 [Clostridia bacterium]|nr:hypothetical protein [Clostridia bacterium]